MSTVPTETGGEVVASAAVGGDPPRDDTLIGSGDSPPKSEVADGIAQPGNEVVGDGDAPPDGAVPDEGGEDDDGGEKKPKLSKGFYKLGKKQFMANPYVYIPGKLLTKSSFNFTKVFDLLGIPVPELIFRLSQALPPSNWNFRLPKSRLNLIDAYKKLQVAKRKLRSSAKSSKGPITSKGKGDNDHEHNLRGSIDHYCGVLEENCKRLLRNAHSACIEQACCVYRVREIWSDKFDDDVIAQWAAGSNPKGTGPIMLGVADRSDFHDEIWNQLEGGCVGDYAKFIEREGGPPPDVVLDSRPFFNKTIPIIYDEVTGHPSKSIPHPNITHLVISDNRILLEQKLGEVVQWGMILINGGIRDAELAIMAVQLGLPLVAFKYTGGTADCFGETYDKFTAWVAAKRSQLLVTQPLPDSPFPDTIARGYSHPTWLKPFDDTQVRTACMLNMLVENWPDRHNPTSVFVIDLFSHSEDDVQDKLTQTVTVVQEGAYELGGVLSEQKRISYAWRARHKFVYNAAIYKGVSDFLMLLQTLLTICSTLAASFLTFYSDPNLGDIDKNPPSPAQIVSLQSTLSLLNFVIPLGASIVKSITASTSPYLKYVALKNASVRMESEIYAYRCKVGIYSSRKQPDEEGEEEEEGDDDDSKEEVQGAGGDAGAPNPRRSFFQAIDKIFLELSSSDVQNGTLRMPTFPSAALDDINDKIKSNRKEQNTYLIPMKKKQASGDNPAPGNDDIDKIIDLPGEALDLEVKKGSLLSRVCCKPPKISGLMFEEVRTDDGISPMSSDEYVEIRVIPFVAYFSKRAPSLSMSRNVGQGLGVLFSVMASAFTAFNIISFIPAVLAVSNGVTSLQNYQQIELRLLQTNAARSQLHQVLVWWDALTMIEKRGAQNKDQLVKRTEATIQAQATIFQGGGGGDDEEEEEGGGEKKKE